MGFPSHPRPHGPSWSVLPGCVQGLLRPLFCPAAMLVDLDRGTVQHQGGFVNQVPGDQLLKDMLPHALPAPSAKTGIHTFPGPIPFRQIPPGYPCVQPIQDPVHHDPVTFSRPSSMCRFFRRQQLFEPFPLFFCYFMSFHAPILPLFLSLSTLSLKTLSSISAKQTFLAARLHRTATK